MLGSARIAELLEPFYPTPSDELLAQLSVYLELLLKWNARTNLTSIRTPEEIVTRHFGESLFAARHLPREACTLLDLGSGAGFPGLPIQLARPTLRITLAESQNKKCIFLREAVRVLGVPVEVWAGRAEAMPPDRVFDVVTLRAVDGPEAAQRSARQRLAPGGVMVHLRSGAAEDGTGLLVPGSSHRYVHLRS